jgi:hypothetical protein
MEGFQGEDRHNPLPHIALLTTALKSAYRNTTSLSAHTATELRELLIQGGREWWLPGRSSSSTDVTGLREVCYRAKAAAFQVGCSPDYTRRRRRNVLRAGDLMPCQRVLAPVTGAGPPQAAESVTARIPPRWNIWVLRRDWLCGLIREYAQVA